MEFKTGGKMEKIIMMIEESENHFGAYSDNCEGIYAAGDTIEAVKADTLEAISLIKKNLPVEQWPSQLLGEYEIVWKLIPRTHHLDKEKFEMAV